MSSRLYVHAHCGVFPLAGERKADTTALRDYEDPRSLRRISHFCRLALLAARRCMQGRAEDPSAIGLVTASAFGPLRTLFDFADSLQDYGPQMASPTAFSTSVYNIAASVISIHMGITGPVHSVSQGGSSLFAALDIARMWLDDGRVPAVLLGVVDEYEELMEKSMLRAGDCLRALPVEGALFMLLSKNHGPAVLHSWNLAQGETPAPLPQGNVLLEGDLQGTPLAGRTHPAGPVHAFASALESGQKGRCFCGGVIHDACPAPLFAAIDYERTT